MERDSGHGDDRGGRGVAIERSPTGLAVGLRRGVVGARACRRPRRLGRRRDHDYHALVRRRAEGVPQVGGGDPPRVCREINQRVDRRPAGALRDEIADQAVSARPRRRPDRPRRARARSPAAPRRPSRPGGSPRRRRAARGRTARVVVRHAQELRGDVTAWCFPPAQRRRGPDGVWGRSLLEDPYSLPLLDVAINLEPYLFLDGSVDHAALDNGPNQRRAARARDTSGRALSTVILARASTR